MNIKTTLSLSALACALLMLPALARAQTDDPAPEPVREFRVEMIIFEYTSPSATEEDWRGPMIQETEQAETGEPAPRKAALSFRSVEPATYKLSSIFQRMRGSRDFRPLIHTAWIQPGYAKSEAPELALGRVARLPQKLNGTARLHLSRFLHLQLDLRLASANSSVLEASAPYHLLESRRMRSGDLHFFDHPKFGAVVRIDPIESDAN